VDAFIAEGATVAACDIDDDALKTLPSGVFNRHVDVAEADALSKFVKDAIQHLGGLDCLINNAGIAGPTAGIGDIDLADWEQTLAICLTSQFVTISQALDALRRSKNPSIVNLSSVSGRVGFPCRTPYAAAKWGVVGLTKSLAIELGPDKIRVNAIMPGLVAGDRQRRVMEARAQSRGLSFDEVEAEAFSLTSVTEYVTPQQIADQVLFIASERGRTISGQAISICGDTRALA
jgi:NAD(P)-dependent dehydrogenase (short-subunit alcohol dehydrogenase family)